MTIVVIMLVFALAGAVKGVIGLGLPSISLALISLAMDLPSAMALLIVPSLVTNFWQMIDGKATWVIFKRIWLFLACATFTVWIGALSLTRVDTSNLSILLGLLLIAYAIVGLTGLKMVLSASKEPWAGPLAGVVNGVLTGMTGSFVVPGVIYLQSLGLARDALIQAMGMLFTVSTIALALALTRNGMLSADLGVLSALAVLPAIAGMLIGSRLRRHLPEHVFRRIFFTALLLLGVYVILSNITIR